MMELKTGNIRRWLESAVSKFGEPLESVVVGKHDNRAWDGDALPDENVPLDPEVALIKLDLEFNRGADCFPIFAWTKSRVFFIGEYDGDTNLAWVPRHPVAEEPKFSGLES